MVEHDNCDWCAGYATAFRDISGWINDDIADGLFTDADGDTAARSIATRCSEQVAQADLVATRSVVKAMTPVVEAARAWYAVCDPGAISAPDVRAAGLALAAALDGTGDAQRPGDLIGYKIGDRLYHPADVTIVRAAPPVSSGTGEQPRPAEANAADLMAPLKASVEQARAKRAAQQPQEEA